jgi:hypothetical protein
MTAERARSVSTLVVRSPTKATTICNLIYSRVVLTPPAAAHPLRFHCASTALPLRIHQFRGVKTTLVSTPDVFRLKLKIF